MEKYKFLNTFISFTYKNVALLVRAKRQDFKKKHGLETGFEFNYL